MTDTPFASLPAEGLLLWKVEYKSHYYDSDPRDSGNVSVGHNLYILAKTKNSAMKKAEKELEKLTAGYTKEIKQNASVTTEVVSLENLVAAEKLSPNAGLGYIRMGNLAEVELSVEEDKKKYRIGVCLIPNGEE